MHQKAQQSVEQEISDFLRITTIPGTNNETNTSRTTNASFDKRIKTLQDTKKELEKKITSYHSDISRIQAGDIPHNYSSSKDILSNIKSTAVKVASGSLKHRSSNNNDQPSIISTPSINEQLTPSLYTPEPDSHHHNINFSSSLATPTTTVTSTSTSGGGNSNQNISSQSQHNNSYEPAHSTVSSSTSNEVGNSQFYIDSTRKLIRFNSQSKIS